MSLKNYYQIMGVSKDANAKDIKKAFRELALRFHPDRNAGNSEEAEERFKEINEAYEVLGDEQKRQYYDHLVGWSDYRRETIVVENIFRAFSRRKSWGCKRQRGWRRRREQYQE
jgi:DnaJ-class molecular chaperone